MRKKKRRLKKKFRVLLKRFTLISVVVISALALYDVITANATTTSLPTKPTELPVLSVQYKNKEVIQKFNGEVRKVAYLTFDDGPTAHSGRLIETLEKYDVPATHFLIGSNINQYPEYVKQFHERGDYVGMHSMTHNYNTLYVQGKVVDEMKEAQSLIKNLTGESPILFRSPYGSNPGLNASLRDKVVKNGLKTWDWSVDSEDWKFQNNPNKIAESVKAQLKRPIEVILLHDKKGTIDALPVIIETIREAGYEFDVYEEQLHFPVNFFGDKRM